MDLRAHDEGADGVGSICVKVLVQPSSSGKEASGFHDTSFHNIMKCAVDIRMNLYGHVMLPGGTTIFQWIHDEGIDSVFSIHDEIKVNLSCSSQHHPADVDLEGEYDDLARASFLSSPF